MRSHSLHPYLDSHQVHPLCRLCRVATARASSYMLPSRLRSPCLSCPCRTVRSFSKKRQGGDSARSRGRHRVFSYAATPTEGSDGESFFFKMLQLVAVRKLKISLLLHVLYSLRFLVTYDFFEKQRENMSYIGPLFDPEEN
jgi:hypothetical protein